MTAIQNYPNLDIIPTEKICLHENHDPNRTLPLKKRIQTSGILNNPPLVIPVSAKNEQYMVLDGANRVTALKDIGLPHLLVQIVNPDSPGVSLQTWNHVIWNIDPDLLAQEIENLEGITLVTASTPTFSELSLGFLFAANHRGFSIRNISSDPRSTAITKLVRRYSQLARYDRTMIEDTGSLAGYYKDFAGLIIYPPFQISEVLQFCQDDKLLPAGITRFVVSPRALRVNYPLANMAGDKPLQEKRLILKNFIQDRMDKKGVRIYTEMTVLYDE